MSAVLVFTLFAVTARAGVVMPVENGVAPAGTYVPAAPVSVPAPGGLGAPSLGGFLGLNGGLPRLPAPVPGLAGPALHFVGEVHETAAAVQPQAAAVKPAQASETGSARASDKTPAIPAKPVAGSAGLAISRDRKSAASTPGGEPTITRAPGDEAARRPVVDPGAFDASRTETAVELGRGFFDRSRGEGRGSLQDPAYGGKAGSALTAAGSGGAFTAPSGLSFSQPSLVAGGHEDPGANGMSYAQEGGETLRDAVASAGSAAGAPLQGGPAALSYFGSASPNGDPAAVTGLKSAAASGTPFPSGAPSPLALDRSPSGLVLRVRSALNGVLGVPSESSGFVPRAVPGPSTALLERGGMLEAFSTAGAYAEGPADGAAAGASVVKPAKAGGSLSALDPRAEAAPAPLWWAWFLLPLLIAAFRGL